MKKMGVEAEFREIEEMHWNVFFQELHAISTDLPFEHGLLPENKGRNRYRGICPFDHSRVCLQTGTNDYINASLVLLKEARRRYILTQGPLPTTCGHFWQMVWEQRSCAVVMLNRIIELGAVQCTQYWPPAEIRELLFQDTGFRLALIREEEKANCIIRSLELENLQTEETRHIVHFQYTAWPDCGTPDSPSSLLGFIFCVRLSGCLSEDKGPTVVHCSAGVGRSGVFCLVDACLLLMSVRRDPYSVCVRQTLLELRRYRKDLVETPEQLRFAYTAIIEGSRPILGCLALQEPPSDSDEEDAPLASGPPSPPQHGVSDSCFFSGTEEEEERMTCKASCPVGPRMRAGRWRDRAPALVAPVSRCREANPRRPVLGLRTAEEQGPTATRPARRTGDGAAGNGAALLASLYVCFSLALGAYICYRACLR